jgi:hypothetical protein
VLSLQPMRSAESAVPGVLRDGYAVMGITRASPDSRDEVVVHRFAFDGTHLGVMARAEGMVRYSGPGFSGPHPLSPRARLALARGELYVAETMTPRIRVFEPATASEREITWDPAPSAAPAAVLRMVRDSAVARSSPDLVESVRRRLEVAPVPERIPLFWDLIVDDEGFVWLRPYEPLRHAVALGASLTGGAGPGGRWLILSPDGLESGWVDMPASLEPIRITRDAVVGIARDELDVESVRVHALRRR